MISGSMTVNDLRKIMQKSFTRLPGRVLVITEDQGLRHMELPNNFPGLQRYAGVLVQCQHMDPPVPGFYAGCYVVIVCFVNVTIRMKDSEEVVVHPLAILATSGQPPHTLFQVGHGVGLAGMWRGCRQPSL